MSTDQLIETVMGGPTTTALAVVSNAEDPLVRRFPFFGVGARIPDVPSETPDDFAHAVKTRPSLALRPSSCFD